MSCLALSPAVSLALPLRLLLPEPSARPGVCAGHHAFSGVVGGLASPCAPLAAVPKQERDGWGGLGPGVGAAGDRAGLDLLRVGGPPRSAPGKPRAQGVWVTGDPVEPQTADGREEGPQAAAVITADQPRRPDELNTFLLRDPELTGMAIEQLDALGDSLIAALAHRHERLRREHRGGERLRARGAGAKDRLSDADRILAAVPGLRKIGTHDLLVRLFGIAGSTLTRAVQEVRPLLAEHAIPSSTAGFRTPKDVAAHLDTIRQPGPEEDQTRMLILCEPLA